MGEHKRLRLDSALSQKKPFFITFSSFLLPIFYQPVYFQLYHVSSSPFELTVSQEDMESYFNFRACRFM
jgi:hypothetical protein